MHERDRIRQVVYEQLVSWIAQFPTALTKIYDTPVYAVQTKDLPLVMVYNTGDENVSEGDSRHQVGSDVVRYLREMAVIVEARLPETAPVARNMVRDLDNWAEQIELAMDSLLCNFLGQSVQSIDYKDTEWGQNKDGDSIYGFVAVSYTVRFFTQHADTSRADFTGIDADYHLGAPGDQPDGPHAEDDIDFP